MRRCRNVRFYFPALPGLSTPIFGAACLQRAPQFLRGPLPAHIRPVQPAVVQNRTRRRERHARGHSQRPHSHDRRRQGRTIQEIQQSRDITGSVGLCRDLHRIRAGIRSPFGEAEQAFDSRRCMKIMERSQHRHASGLCLSNDRPHPAQRTDFEIHHAGRGEQSQQGRAPVSRPHRVFAAFGRMPCRDDPRKSAVHDFRSDAIRPPLQKIHARAFHSSRDLERLERIDDAHDLRTAA